MLAMQQIVTILKLLIYVLSSNNISSFHPKVCCYPPVNPDKCKVLLSIKVELSIFIASHIGLIETKGGLI